MPYKDPVVRAAYNARWIARRRADWLSANGPCVECGSWDDLQVDHKDPTQKVSHRVWSWSAERRAAELAKCQVLCRPCHEVKTAAENSERMGGLRHGTEAMYGKRKCRCEPCRAARSAVKNERRRRRVAAGLPRDGGS